MATVVACALGALIAGRAGLVAIPAYRRLRQIKAAVDPVGCDCPAHLHLLPSPG
jgi:hypothetical protein